MRRFQKQPVGVRAAWISAVIGVLGVGAVTWDQGRRDDRVRAEERRLTAQRELQAELIPQVRRVGDLILSLATSLRMRGEVDSATVDSLRVLAEGMLVPETGIRTRISRVYGDSVAAQFSSMVQGADSLFHGLTVLHYADRQRTSQDALNDLRSDLLTRAVDVGRRSNYVLNMIIAAQ